MRMKLPLIRSLAIAPARTPALRYGVALLSTVLALIPTLFFSNIAESRLVVFAVAVMVSAWYGGWKPGLAATSFALTVSACYSLTGKQTPAEYHKAIAHLALFFAVALLICWFNAALRAAQEGLRRSESNFRSLVMNAPYGICRCDALGILQDANPALVALFGYDSAAELTGRHLGSLYADAQQWFQTADYFRARKEFNNLTTECVRKDGASIVARISGRSIPNGKDGGAFEIFIEDVTETRTLELQFRQAQKMEAIGRLAGGIAHDFNNLLMVISGYSEFLLERLGSDPRLRGPAQEISNATQRATSLTRQLLAFSRKQVLEFKLLSLNSIVSDTDRMLRRLIGEDIRLRLHLQSNLALAKADPAQIEQVIMNLAVNARDAMPHGGELLIETANVTVDERTASPGAIPSHGSYVMLAVSDTGAGIDSETQTHIFDPFFTTKPAGKGTGLGLATVYGIVKQSGGYIRVVSQLGQGARFEIFLPQVEGTADSLKPPKLSTEVRGGNETILLAEDSAALRAFLCENLQKLGYKVLPARDGPEALHVAEHEPIPIHLLITDVVMPGMSGPDLVSQMKSLRPDIKVLLMSGYPEDHAGRNPDLDPQSFLQKPFEMADLAQKIRAALTPNPKKPR